MSRHPDPSSIPDGPCQSCSLAQRCRDARPEIACQDFAEFVTSGRVLRESPYQPRRPTAAVAARLGL